NGLELLFHLAENPVIGGASGTVPQLDTHHVTEHGSIAGRDVAHAGSNGRIAARSERLDPRRGVNEEPLTSAQGSSRIRRSSSCVMKPSRVPNFSTSFWSRRRRLKSDTAMTTASRFVLAPVCLMACRSSSLGISRVVFIPSIIDSWGFQIKRLRNPGTCGEGAGMDTPRAMPKHARSAHVDPVYD